MSVILLNVDGSWKNTLKVEKKVKVENFLKKEKKGTNIYTLHILTKASTATLHTATLTLS